MIYIGSAIPEAKGLAFASAAMRIACGSMNPVKRDAVAGAFDRISRDVVVDKVSVDSGVAEQPRGHSATREGARNRAGRALGPGYDLAVGIEGGVAARDDLWLVMWAAATDGEAMSEGAGPQLRLPDTIAQRVAAGEELGPVMDDVLGAEDVARNQGAAGALTGGIIDRESALRHAVAGALGPFVTDHYG